VAVIVYPRSSGGSSFRRAIVATVIPDNDLLLVTCEVTFDRFIMASL
jgi:hypothetical protein